MPADPGSPSFDRITPEPISDDDTRPDPPITIAIAGAAGFVGSSLASRLAKRCSARVNDYQSVCRQLAL